MVPGIKSLGGCILGKSLTCSSLKCSLIYIVYLQEDIYRVDKGKSIPDYPGIYSQRRTGGGAMRIEPGALNCKAHAPTFPCFDNFAFCTLKDLCKFSELLRWPVELGFPFGILTKEPTLHMPPFRVRGGPCP